MSNDEARPRTKVLRTRPNRLGIGIDVGWGFDGTDFVIWWGNTKDETTLAALITDLRQHNTTPFELGDEVSQ